MMIAWSEVKKEAIRVRPERPANPDVLRLGYMDRISCRINDR